MKKFLTLTLLFSFIVSCSSNDEDLKSPCVSLEEGPCGPKKPVNYRIS
jgi:hypothetical protein